MKTMTVILVQIPKHSHWYAQMPDRGPLRDAAIFNNYPNGLVPLASAISVPAEVALERAQASFPNAQVQLSTSLSRLST